MDLKILGGNGLHASETRAVQAMQRELRSSWFGYASLLVADDQGSMDVDTLIVTHDRVLLVELKEWNGKLESSDGQWFINGQSRGKSPYEIKRVHAIRLGKLLQQELEHKLGYFPRVEAHVVLCGSAKPDGLSTSERRFVHTLDEFLKISSADGYNAVVEAASPGYLNLFERGKPRPNNEKCRPIFQSFFAGGRIRPKRFTHHGYVADPQPCFEHRAKLFSEFRGTHKEVSNDVALMRRWDFNALGVGNATQSQWAHIALRESRVFSHARSHERGIEEYLLRPLIPLAIEDVTEDFTELYELRRTYSRLDEYLTKNRNALTQEARIDLCRALIAPFAELHALGIAHRDIDLHNLWHAAEQRSVVLSGFAAAFFPERGTVSDLRESLQGSGIRLPEDALRMDGDILDPFRQDVFMLSAAAFRICFPGEPLPTGSDGIWQWQPRREDPFSGNLNAWFEKGLAWEPERRFENASEMLAALNELSRPYSASNSAEAAELWDRICEGSFIRRGWGLFQVLTAYAPAPSENPMPGHTLRYLTSVEGAPALCKVWSGVAAGPNTPGLNRRLVAFRTRVEQIARGPIATPRVLDFGLLESGGLLLVSSYEQGVEWAEYVRYAGDVQRANLALSLCKAVHVLHERGLGHGDIHPGNLLVTSAEDETGASRAAVLLLDLLDFGDKTEPFNVEYGPPNPSIADAMARDRFAVYKLVDELTQGYAMPGLSSEIARGFDQPFGIPVALEPLLTELDRLVKPAVEPALVEQALPLIVEWKNLPVSSAGLDLVHDEGTYHFNCVWSKRNDKVLNCYITGLNAALEVCIDPEERQVRDVRLRNGIALSELVSASAKATARIPETISVRDAIPSAGGKAALIDRILGLDPVLELLEARFAPSDPSEPLELAENNDVPTERIWRALLETEHESMPELDVCGETEEDRSGSLLVPYELSGRTVLDFARDDRVLVYCDGDDQVLGNLDLEATSPDTLVIHPSRSSNRRMIRRGMRLRLESIQSKASRDRRAKAMARALDRATVIPNLVEYFDPGADPSGGILAERPSEEKIRRLYDSGDSALNPRQVEAFQELVEKGPVGVLQGPPGTGKTTFVAAFIHYLLSELDVRNILLVGQSHTAVDAVAVKARSVCADHDLPLSVVRIGQEKMLVTDMLDSHSRAIQRQMRHAFHREYEHRVRIFANRLALPAELVGEAASLHRTLDGLLDSRKRYVAEQERLARSASVEDGERSVEVVAQLDEVNALISRIVFQKFPDDAVELLAATDPWHEMLVRLARQHGINNPAALSRLKAVFQLSQEWLAVLHTGEANYDQFLVRTRQLVCGTLVGMGQKQLGVGESQFDWVIVDEAARASASELVIPLQAGRRILLVGDHKQLPPLYERPHVRAAARLAGVSEERMRTTDFERAFEACGGVTLDTQYRMVEPIGELVSECFYKDAGVRLRTGRGREPEWFDAVSSALPHQVLWVDSGKGANATGEDEHAPGRYINVHEVRLILRLLERLSRGSALAALQGFRHGASRPIGIIAMYRAQRDLIERELSKAEWAGAIRNLVRIDTVDSYQGQENPVVILSLVRDNLSENQGFMWEPSRINVAISRAQERLIVVGATRMWERKNRNGPLGEVLAFVRSRAQDQQDKYRILDEDSLREMLESEVTVYEC